ncbi:MAG: hypothetical protein LBN98_07045, partial [Prevotellaceae bacterium]|jgi:hypothetical protein|nr:hypothetical protein [Prevotellaceae bacterium]
VSNSRLCGCRTAGCAGVEQQAVRVSNSRLCGCRTAGCAGIIPHHHIITSPHHHITTSSHHHITTSPHHPIIFLLFLKKMRTFANIFQEITILNKNQ